MKIVEKNQYEDDYDDEYYDEEPHIIVVKEGSSIWTTLLVLGIVGIALYGVYYYYIKSPIMQAGQAVMNIPNSFGMRG